MLKQIFFSAFLVLCFFSNLDAVRERKNRIQKESLPPPYSTLSELKPFVNHGWYQNNGQLRRLIKDYNIKVIVEIGSWLGQSTIDLARHIPSDGILYAIDTWKGSAEHQPGQACWHPCMPYLYEQFLSNIIHVKLTHKVIPMKMTSLEAASILDLSPDMVYIDSDHSTESVYNDLCAWFPFVKGHGILCGDDWLWNSVAVAVKQFALENDLTIHSSGNFWRLEE